MTVGVLVMSYGTPPSPDAIEEYYTHIRRGRPPSAEQLANLTARYDAIGGISPLRERTRAQVSAIETALGDGFDVRMGFKHTAPFADEVATAMSDAGCETIVGIVLAPQYSGGSVEQYHDKARAGCSDKVDYRAVNSWNTEPAFVSFMADGLRATLADMPEATKVVFTAHSLPERVLAGGDPYPDEVYASAEAIAKAVGLGEWAAWSQVWQSAGATPDPWRGPDILSVIDDLAETGRADGLVVCPVGFVADHLEVLYDLDIEARDRCQAHGLRFARTPVVNADTSVMTALADRVRLAAA